MDEEIDFKTIDDLFYNDSNNLSQVNNSLFEKTQSLINTQNLYSPEMFEIQEPEDESLLTVIKGVIIEKLKNRNFKNKIKHMEEQLKLHKLDNLKLNLELNYITSIFLKDNVLRAKLNYPIDLSTNITYSLKNINKNQKKRVNEVTKSVYIKNKKSNNIT